MSHRATARTTSLRTTTPRSTPRTRSTPRPTPRPELRLVPGVTATRPRRQAASIFRHKRAPFVLLVVALLVGTTLGLLVLNTAIAVDSLKATQLRAENAERAQELQRLEQPGGLRQHAGRRSRGPPRPPVSCPPARRPTS